MDLRAVLRAFGFENGAAQVQPDVSGSTIANLLRQTAHDPGLLLPALGSLYEGVFDTAPAAGVMHIDLWRDGTPYAALLRDETSALRCTFT